MSRVNTYNVLARFRDNNWEQGKDLVKICRVKKRVEEGGQRKRALDDALCKPKKFCRARKGLDTNLALQCCAGLVSGLVNCGFPCKVA